jgi:glucose/arabinose dehydrogenase
MGWVGRLRFISWLVYLWVLVPYVLALPPGFVVQTVVAEADFPGAMAFTPDGTRLFFTERFTGHIRVYDLTARELLPTPFATVEVNSQGLDERGLLGIALDPAFEANHFVYVFHHPAQNFGRITRFTDVANIGQELQIIVDHIPAASFHNGGYLGFGPDGKLYLTVGENGVASNAQDLTVLPGKLHRFNPDGTIPADNPFPGSSIWSYGLRNSFGFSFHPVTGSLLLSEPGPSANDEINRIVKGGNYGWPEAVGCAGEGQFIDPLLAFAPVVTPNGNLVFASNRYPATFLYGLFFGEWNTGRIRWSTPVGSPDTGATPPMPFLELPGDSILDLKMGPDGNLWFSTPDSIRRIIYTLPLKLPAAASHGTPAIDNQIILSLLGKPGEDAFVLLSLKGTAIRRLLHLEIVPSSGVASRVVAIPDDPMWVGKTIVSVGASIDSANQTTFTDPLEAQILGRDSGPACVETR